MSTLGLLSHQVVVHLPGVCHHDPAALSRQGSLYVLHPETGQAVSVLDHDGDNRCVGQQAGELGGPPVHPRADLAHHIGDGHALGGGPFARACHLRVEVGSLVMGGDSGVDDRPPVWFALAAWHVHEDRPRRGLGSRDRKLAVPEPPPCGLVVDTFLLSPLGELHTRGIRHMFVDVQ